MKMTISIDTTRQDLIDIIKVRSHIIYDWIDVEKEYLPVSIRISEDFMDIYLTDDFAKFVIEFFSEWFIGVLNSSSKKKSELLSKDFRRKGEEYFVSNIILHEDD